MPMMMRAQVGRQGMRYAGNGAVYKRLHVIDNHMSSKQSRDVACLSGLLQLLLLLLPLL